MGSKLLKNIGFHCYTFTDSINQITELHFRGIQLDPAESKQCARGVFTMESLRLLQIRKTLFDDKFFTEMSKAAPESQVQF